MMGLFKAGGRAFLLMAMALSASAAHATTIAYSATSLGASHWRYDYVVTNNTLAGALDEFTIFFDEKLYTQLALLSVPNGWDPLIIQPDKAIPAPGFYDALALNGGVAHGASLSGFAVTFDYLGTGAPSAQKFSIVDSVAFAEREAGVTVGAAPIPLPGTAWLLFSGALAMTAGLRRRKQSSNANLTGANADNLDITTPGGAQ